MRKLLITVALVFVALQAASAQSTRIQFARGKSSAVVNGSTRSYGVSYLVKARAGQKMIVSLKPLAGVGIRINTENGGYVLLRLDKGGSYEVDLPETGNYEIFIGSDSHRSLPFTLAVRITG